MFSALVEHPRMLLFCEVLTVLSGLGYKVGMTGDSTFLCNLKNNYFAFLRQSLAV